VSVFSYSCSSVLPHIFGSYNFLSLWLGTGQCEKGTSPGLLEASSHNELTYLYYTTDCSSLFALLYICILKYPLFE
jgi:hypothetical protein